MYAYPIAGSQADFIQVLLFCVAAVCLGDSLFWLCNLELTPHSISKQQKPLAIAALVILTLVDLAQAYDHYGKYRDAPSLDLPGARLLHVSPEQKTNFHWLVSNLRESCDSFEGLPGMYSLNFWTGIYPLTGFNMDSWMFCLSEEQQRKVVEAIARHPRACIVSNPTVLKMWQPAEHQWMAHLWSSIFGTTLRPPAVPETIH